MKRKRGAWNQFFSETGPVVRAELPDLKSPEVMKEVARRWKALDDGEKETWKEKAEEYNSSQSESESEKPKPKPKKPAKKKAAKKKAVKKKEESSDEEPTGASGSKESVSFGDVFHQSDDEVTSGDEDEDDITGQMRNIVDDDESELSEEE